MLNELESKFLLASYGIPINKGYEASSADDAAKKAMDIGFPVVVKVLSGIITHKSDLGLVELDICSAERVKEAYDRMISIARGIDPGATIVVESQAQEGIEVIVGAKRDPQFGLTVLFGLGGVFVEVFQDVSIRVAPINEKIAKDMISEIKGYKILKGYRGKKGIDIYALSDIIIKVSRFMMECDDAIELDINPVMAYEDGAVAVDARILFRD